MATNHCCGIPRLFSSVFDYEATDDGSKLRCSFKYCTCNAKWMTNVPKFTDKLSRHVGDSVDRFVTRTYGKRHLYKSGKFPIQPSLSFASGRSHISQTKQQHHGSQSHYRQHHHTTSTTSTTTNNSNNDDDDDDDYNGDNEDAGNAQKEAGEDGSNTSTSTEPNEGNGNTGAGTTAENNATTDANNNNGGDDDDDDGFIFYDDDDDYDENEDGGSEKTSGHGHNQEDGGNSSSSSTSHNPKSGTVEDKFSSIIVVVLELDDDDDNDRKDKEGSRAWGAHDTIARWLPDVADSFYNSNSRTKPHPSVIVRRFRSRKQLLDKIVLEELHNSLSYEHATRYYNVHLNLGGGGSCSNKESLSGGGGSNSGSSINLNASSGSMDGSSESSLASGSGAGNDIGSSGSGNDSSNLCMSVYSLPVFIVLNVPPLPPTSTRGGRGGQVFCCTPSYIQREYGIREYCTVRDFVVTCQMAIGPRLCGFYIASNGALALGSASWPVDPAWITDGSLCTDVVGFAGTALPAEKKACDVYVILSVMEYAVAKMRNTFDYAGTSFSTVCRVLRSMGRPLLNSVLVAQEKLLPKAAASGHLALLNTMGSEAGSSREEDKKRAVPALRRGMFTVGFVYTSQGGKRAAECLSMLLRDTVDTVCLSGDNVVSVINSRPVVEDGGAFLLVVLNFGGNDNSAAATGAKLEAILGALFLTGLGKKLCGVLNVCDSEHSELPPQYAASCEVASMLTSGVQMSVWWALTAYTAIKAAALSLPSGSASKTDFSSIVSQCREECSGLAAAAGLVVLGRKEGDELSVPVDATAAAAGLAEGEIERKASEYYALSMKNRVAPDAADDGSSIGGMDEDNESDSNSGSGDNAEYVYVYDNADMDEDEYDDSDDDEEYVDDYKFSEKKSSKGEGASSSSSSAGDPNAAGPSLRSSSSRRHHRHRHHRHSSSSSRESKERSEAQAAAANNAEGSCDEAGEGEEDDADSSSSNDSSNEPNNNSSNNKDNGSNGNANKGSEQQVLQNSALTGVTIVPQNVSTTSLEAVNHQNIAQPTTATTPITGIATTTAAAPVIINPVNTATSIVAQQNLAAGGGNAQVAKMVVNDGAGVEQALNPLPAKRVRIDPNVISCPITAGVLFEQQQQQQQQQNVRTVVNPPTIITPGGLPIVGATPGTTMYTANRPESTYKPPVSEVPREETNAIIHINELCLDSPENKVVFTSPVSPVAPPKAPERVIGVGDGAYIKTIHVNLDVHISEDGPQEQNWINGIAEYFVQEEGVRAGSTPRPFTLYHEGVIVEAVVLVNTAQSTRLDAQITRNSTTVVIPPHAGVGAYTLVVGFHVERNNPHIVWARDADSHYAMYSLFTRPACARSLFPYPLSAMSAAIMYDVTVVTPAAYTALVPTATQWSVKTLRDGTKRCSEFHVKTPASLAMLALAVGRFSMRQVPDAPVPLTFWGPESLVQRAANGLGGPLKECFRIMCEMLGFNPYPAVNVVVMPPNYPYPANQSLGTVYVSMSLFDVGKPLVEYVVLELVQGYFNTLFTENVTCARYLAKGISRYIEERIMFAQSKLKMSSEEDTLNVASLLLYRTLLAKLPSNTPQKPQGAVVAATPAGCVISTPTASTAAAVAAAAERRINGGGVEIPESKDDNSEVEYNDEIGYFLMRHLSQRVAAGNLCKFVGQFVTSYAGNVFTPELFVTAFFDAHRELVSADFNSASILLEWFHSTGSKSIDVKLDNTIRSICLSKDPRNPVLGSVDDVLVLTYKFETEIIKTDAAAKKEAIEKLETAKMTVSLWTNDQTCIFLKRLCEGTLLHPETIELLDAIFLFKDMNARVRRGWCDVVHKGDYKKWILYVNNFIMNDKPFSYGVTENSHSQIPPF